MIIKRNLLCVKAKEKLDIGQLLLYEPYKNILLEFKELCVDINAKDFDPVAKVYDGLMSTPPEIKEYYEALLGVTSYYQHSQGGKGKYIEKKIASSFASCSLNIELSTLPIWLEHPTLYKKKGIYTLNGLSSEEKKSLREFEIEWNWISDRDVKTDVGSIIEGEKSIILLEIKNRVDSGGVAARREIWTSEKFGIFVDYLDSNKKLFRKNKKEFSLVELFEHFDIKTFEIYIGVLFDKTDNPATIEIDKMNGFYSSSKQGFEYLRSIIKKSKSFNIIKEDSKYLQIELGLTYSNLKIKIGALYGNDVTLKLFRKNYSVSDLLLLKYDDIWLAQLVAIDERTILLKNRRNFTTIFFDLFNKDKNIKIKYNNLINAECGISQLKDITMYIIDKYNDFLEDNLLPKDKNKDEYLSDVIQVLASADA